MDIEKELLSGFSKANTLRVSQMIGSDQDRFDRLATLVFQPDPALAARAAWVLRHCHQHFPGLVRDQHVKNFVHQLTKPHPDAVKRNITAILQYADIPPSCEGPLVDQCFNFLNSRSEATAVKIFSMCILYKMAVKYPDLKSELEGAISNQMPTGSAGFKNRGTKIIRALSVL